jgi:hypothetical protein
MSGQTATSTSRKEHWLLGAGGLLSLLWCSIALATDPHWQGHLLTALLTTLGGFIPALAGLLWLDGHTGGQSVQGKRKFNSLWLAISLLYPLAMLGGFAWASNQPAPLLINIITQPLLLIFNLTASLLIGHILMTFNFPKGLTLAAWWLWQLPLIFINGTVLRQLHFSNLLMLLYLVTILALSFALSLKKSTD